MYFIIVFSAYKIHSSCTTRHVYTWCHLFWSYSSILIEKYCTKQQNETIQEKHNSIKVRVDYFLLDTHKHACMQMSCISICRQTDLMSPQSVRAALRASWHSGELRVQFTNADVQYTTCYCVVHNKTERGSHGSSWLTAFPLGVRQLLGSIHDTL